MVRFKGHVLRFDDKEVTVRMEPDDDGPEELWTMELDRVPKRWLARGAMFELDIHPKSGRVIWTFNASFWTKKQVEEIKVKAKTLQERWGIP